MQLIRCTQKLLKEMGLKKSDLKESEPSDSFLGSWHANLLYIDRKKSVLFVNDKTLFNFIILNLKRSQIKNLSNLFFENLLRVAAAERLSKKARESIKREYQDIGYAKTNNKSVLGSMNDLAFHYKYNILDEGGINNAMLPEIIHRLNHMPMGALTYVFPIEAIKKLYAEEV